jgi:hypothetical protein
VYDECGVCEGTGACLSPCDGLPWGQRADVCDVCGGDSSTCVEFNSTVAGIIERIPRANSSSVVIGAGSIAAIVAAIVATTLICAALIAAFFIYKKRTNPYFFLPSGMVDK